ncbi:protein KTI12 homolog [Clytia hemisphaerica]|uniref:protein KTI12 homolog n=1 Tax=Clytia hemisphaerica TaxID=252671 RepID=UPI0034D6AF9A
MPLIVLCGFPSSGKTKTRKELVNYLENKNIKVKIISENVLVDEKKNEIYSDSTKEKSIRSALRAAVERDITRDTVTIVDGLNYLKSLRYEMHCIVKAEKTLHCVIYCGITKEKCKEWNESRNENEKYRDEVLDGLFMRFEPPDSNKRWDSPLFTITQETPLSFDDVYDSLYKRSAPPPNQSTIPTPLSSGNFMHDLDQVTQSIIKEILDMQKTAMIGDSIKITDSTEKLVLLKQLNMPELRRIKRQFISYAKMHPVEDMTKLRNMFVQFLNNTIR